MPVLGPAHRAAELQRGERDQRRLHGQRALGAEAAADVRDDDADRRFGRGRASAPAAHAVGARSATTTTRSAGRRPVPPARRAAPSAPRPGAGSRARCGRRARRPRTRPRTSPSRFSQRIERSRPRADRRPARAARRRRRRVRRRPRPRARLSATTAATGWPDVADLAVGQQRVRRVLDRERRRRGDVRGHRAARRSPPPSRRRRPPPRSRRACACGERTNAMCAVSGSAMSSR